MKIDDIPKGREKRISGTELCEKLKIGKTELRLELSELKEKYIILCDDGYYRPTKIEEYDLLIKNFFKNKQKIDKNIELALKEREDLI